MLTGRSEQEYLTFSRVKREAFMAAAQKMRGGGGSEGMSGDDALNFMRQRAAGG